MKVLITGGAGFIGSHLIRLLSEENIPHFVLDNLSTGRRENLLASTPFIEGDLLDIDLEKLFSKEKFDHIVHLAGQTQVSVSLQDPLFDTQENILASIRLVEVARKHAIKRIIFASSAALYGDVDAALLPLTEDLSPAPLSFYGLSKLTIEKYLAMYQHICKLSYICLRFANVYGERQGDSGEGGVISIFAKNIAQKKPLTIFGDGTQTRDFIYAGDIARGILKALFVSENHANRAYNLSTATETSIQQIVDIFSTITAEKITPHQQAKRAGDIYRSALACKEAEKNLAWRATTPLTEGLKKTYEYFKG